MKPGDALGGFERTVTLTDMVAYAGATWDWHRLHYDAEFLTQAGVPKPVVDGQMLGALMAEQILDYFGPRAFITSLSFRFKAMVFAGDTVRCEGEIADVGEGRVRVTQRVMAGDRVAAEGGATIRL